MHFIQNCFSQVDEPQNLTKEKIKAILIQLGIELPTKEQTKEYYLQLYSHAIAEMEAKSKYDEISCNTNHLRIIPQDDDSGLYKTPSLAYKSQPEIDLNTTDIVKKLRFSNISQIPSKKNSCLSSPIYSNDSSSISQNESLLGLESQSSHASKNKGYYSIPRTSYPLLFLNNNNYEEEIQEIEPISKNKKTRNYTINPNESFLSENIYENYRNNNNSNNNYEDFQQNHEWYSFDNFLDYSNQKIPKKSQKITSNQSNKHHNLLKDEEILQNFNKIYAKNNEISQHCSYEPLKRTISFSPISNFSGILHGHEHDDDNNHYSNSNSNQKYNKGSIQDMKNPKEILNKTNLNHGLNLKYIRAKLSNSDLYPLVLVRLTDISQMLYSKFKLLSKLMPSFMRYKKFMIMLLLFAIVLMLSLISFNNNNPETNLNQNRIIYCDTINISSLNLNCNPCPDHAHCLNGQIECFDAFILNDQTCMMNPIIKHNIEKYFIYLSEYLKHSKGNKYCNNDTISEMSYQDIINLITQLYNKDEYFNESIKYFSEDLLKNKNINYDIIMINNQLNYISFEKYKEQIMYTTYYEIIPTSCVIKLFIDKNIIGSLLITLVIILMILNINKWKSYECHYYQLISSIIKTQKNELYQISNEYSIKQLIQHSKSEQ